MNDPLPTIYEADEVAQRLCILGHTLDTDCGEAIEQDWTPYDALGRQYIVDLPNGQAFLITVEPYPNMDEHAAT
jgi:hypothetical protein